MGSPSLTDLQAFVAVARVRNFRRAAGELGVTPSALSHALRNLETQLGVRLFNRTTRSVALTDAGAQLLARLVPALTELGAALETVNGYRESPRGQLRINAPRAAAELVLAPLLARFLATHPALRVEIVTDDAFVDIVERGFDAGVRYGESLQQDMVAVPLGPPQRFLVVAAPAYLTARGIPQSPRDLMAHNCIGLRFPSGARYRWEFARGGDALAVEVDGTLTVDHMPVALRAAVDGVGLAYVYESQARPLLAAGQLVAVLEDWCPPPTGFYLYYPSRRLVPAGLRAFIDMLRDEFP